MILPEMTPKGKMPPQLDLILRRTREAIAPLRTRRRELERAAEAASARPAFAPALRGEAVALIAEVKRRSPSAGAINPGLDPVRRAVSYVGAGAAAVSVLTDGPFFGGSLEDLRAVAGSVAIPILRKDFILVEEQVLEARAAGASAVLLISRALGPTRLGALHRFARDLGLDALVESHDEAEQDQALGIGATLIGVNARDLDTFRVDLRRALELASRVPADAIVVAESGIATRADVA